MLVSYILALFLCTDNVYYTAIWHYMWGITHRYEVKWKKSREKKKNCLTRLSWYSCMHDVKSGGGLGSKPVFVTSWNTCTDVFHCYNGSWSPWFGILFSKSGRVYQGGVVSVWFGVQSGCSVLGVVDARVLWVWPGWFRKVRYLLR